MANKKVLIAVSSHGELGNTGKQTGYYLSEVTHPFMALVDAGFAPEDIDIVSPQGGKAPMDPSSNDLTDAMNRAFWENAVYRSKLENTLQPSAVNVNDYSAIIYAGGHGTVWDFPDNADLQRLAATIYENNGVVAAVCHGPSALVNLKLSDGSYLVAGKHLAAFTDDEERAVELDSVVPFLLASTLQQRGAIHEPGGLWQEKVVVDGRLVTGQNPASAHKLGAEVAKLLSAVSAD